MARLQPVWHGGEADRQRFGAPVEPLLTPLEFLDFYRILPTDEEFDARQSQALSRVEAWQSSHPGIAGREPVRSMLRSLRMVWKRPRPSVTVQAAVKPQRNILVLYEDEAFVFVGRHYGDGRDVGGPTEPGLFVHSKATDRWLQITAISTDGAQLGRVSPDMVVSVWWDFTPYANRLSIDQPLKTPGSLMFPDRIEYHYETGRYTLRHASTWSSRFPQAETVLYVLRADLIEAFTRVQRAQPAR
jgi:hypothetical protein